MVSSILKIQATNVRFQIHQLYASFFSISLVCIPSVRRISPQNFCINFSISSTVSVMKRPLWNFLSSLNYSSSSSLNMLKPGDVLKQARIFSTSDIAEYAKLTHDHNPLHSDLECARNAGFTDVPVPGLLVASLFPRIIASHFPGAVYVKQSLDFKKPVFVGDEIIGEVHASNIRQLKHKFMVKFVTTCSKNGDTVVIGGEATAIVPTLALKQVDSHD